VDIRTEKLRRLSLWRAGIPSGPITMELNPTNRCNLTCISCWQRAFEYDRRDHLTTERILMLIREAAALGVKEVRIPGAGEPMLRADIMVIMREVKRNGMHGLLITNGTAWTDERIRETVAMQWDCVTFSIDAPSEDANDRLRGKKGTFSLIVKSLRKLNAEKAARGSSLPMVRINTVLSSRNCHLLAQMVEFAREHGCADLQVQPMTVWGMDGKSIALSDSQRSELHHHVEQALSLAERHGIHTNMGAFLTTGIVERADGRMNEMVKEQTAGIEDPFLALPCFEPFYNLVILPDGKASFCSVSGGKDGDSVLNRSLRDVWEGGAYQSIRKTLLDGALRDYCTKCCSVVNMENDRLRKGLMVA